MPKIVSIILILLLISGCENFIFEERVEFHKPEMECMKSLVSSELYYSQGNENNSNVINTRLAYDSLYQSRLKSGIAYKISVNDTDGGNSYIEEAKRQYPEASPEQIDSVAR